MDRWRRCPADRPLGVALIDGVTGAEAEITEHGSAGMPLARRHKRTCCTLWVVFFERAVQKKLKGGVWVERIADGPTFSYI